VSVQIINADCRVALRELPAGSVHCVITSPPYWGLRDYGLESVIWGGTPGCPHEWGEQSYQRRSNDGGDPARKQETNTGAVGRDAPVEHAFCRRCDAWRGALGLEPTPELYVQHILEVFREVKRVLRDDGVMWVNMGDGYTSGGRADFGPALPQYKQATHPEIKNTPRSAQPAGLKPKDLIGMPWRVAFALQQPYHVGPIKEPVDRAWLAGMIDADGTLGIRKQAPRPGRGTNPTFIPYLMVCSSDTSGLERCRQITGMGSINLKAAAGTTDGRGINSRRDYYTWRLDGQLASRVIRDIYPYLVIKQIQAQLVYNMNLSLKWGRPTRSIPVPPDVVRQREGLYEACKLANQRSLVNPPPLKDVDPAIEPGWYLRSEVIWSKPNPMPESVTDRPTRAHEYVFLLSKASRYFYDADAIREASTEPDDGRLRYYGGVNKGVALRDNGTSRRRVGNPVIGNPPTRNKRTVWTIPTQPFPGAHFATFPEALVKVCIQVGMSEWGCCADCCAPWNRVVEKGNYLASTSGTHFPTPNKGNTSEGLAAHLTRDGFIPNRQREIVGTGWRRTCAHEGEPVPCVICDPFASSGTVGVVAQKGGRRAILIDASPDYCAMARERLRQGALL